MLMSGTQKVYALHLAGTTRFIYRNSKSSSKQNLHKIWNVNGTLEILCTCKYFDPDVIEKDIRCYLKKYNK